jgi:hypothetical protein
MNAAAFATVFVLGAGAIAVWLTARFPGLTQSRFRTIALHMLAAFVVAQLVPRAIELAASAPASLFAALFLLALPVLVYTFLVALWLLRLAQSAMGGMLR